MKVALCHHYSLTFHGGGERFLIDAANQLLKRGHEVVIYALPIGRKCVNLDMSLQGIEYHENLIHNINNADVAYFIYAPILHNLFVGSCPKIGAIHAFVFLDELQHPEVRRMSYVNFANEFGIPRFMSHLYFRRVKHKRLNGFDAIHVINKEALRSFQGKNKVYYVPNWIDTSHFKPTENKNEKFSVLFTGRKAKGFSSFVKIAEFLKEKEIDFFAIGPDVESVNNVKSLGFITDVKTLISLYSKMHLLIYTSGIDVFPLTLLEAAACKVPIIAFPTKAIKGLNLPLFYATSTNEFAQKINEIQDMWQAKKEDYLKLADRMRVEIIRYDVNIVFPKFLSMLKEVAACSNESRVASPN